MSTLANRIAKLEQAKGAGIETWTEEQVNARLVELEPALRADVEAAGLDYDAMTVRQLMAFLDAFLKEHQS